MRKKVRAKVRPTQAEEQFRLVVEAAPSAMLLVNPEGLIHLVNGQVEALFGYNRAELLGQPVEMLVPPQLRALHKGYLEAFFTAPATRPMGAGRDLFGVRKDGSLIPVEIGLNPITLPAGRFILASIIDITERKQIEEALLYQANLLQNVSDAVIATDLDFKITSWNRAAAAIYGWSDNEVIGRFTEEILQSRYTHSQPEQIRQALFAQGNWQGEALQSHKDGSTIQVLASVSLIKDRTGKAVGVVMVNRNITEYKRAEEALRLSEERFAKAFRASPDGIGITRLADGQLIEVNDRWSTLFGFSRQEAMGRTLVELNIYSQPSDRQRLISQVKAQGFIRDFEVEVRRKSGELFQVSMSVELVLIAGEQCMLSILRDITEQKRAEAKLNETLAELARSNTELEQFAYIASHDLQEPLRMVSSYTQLLARRYKGKLDADADEFIAFAVDGANRMQQLLKDLLAYSRVGTQGKAFRPTSSEVVLEAALANLQVAITESQATITHDYPLPTVLADEIQLVQLFQNLIGNALKFRSEQPPRVHISAQPEAQGWLFSVRDNGIGLEPQYAERIFVIFQRLHTQENYPGTGIGLAVCKRIVERHGGRIWVEAQPGQGATFCFTLPEGKANDEYLV